MLVKYYYSHQTLTRCIFCSFSLNFQVKYRETDTCDESIFTSFLNENIPPEWVLGIRDVCLCPGLTPCLPLSSSALTIPEPTVPAPPRANTTLSEFDMLATATRARWRTEKDFQRSCRLVRGIWVKPRCFKLNSGHSSALLTVSPKPRPQVSKNSSPLSSPILFVCV